MVNKAKLFRAAILMALIPVTYLLTLIIFSLFMALDSWIEQPDRTALSARIAVQESDVKSYSPLYDTFSHQFVKREYEEGIIGEVDRNAAYAVIDAAIAHFEGYEPPTTSQAVKDYFQAIGAYIGDRFIYENTDSYAEGLKIGGIDCDTRSYLYLSISESIGLTGVFLVAAPSHAYVVWKAPTGMLDVPWETTTETGKIANIDNSSTYRPSKDDAHYKALNGVELQALIDTVIAYELTDAAEKVEDDKIKSEKLNARAFDLLESVIATSPNAIAYSYLADEQTNVEFALKAQEYEDDHKGTVNRVIARSAYKAGDLETAKKHYMIAYKTSHSESEAFNRLYELKSPVSAQLFLIFHITRTLLAEAENAKDAYTYMNTWAFIILYGAIIIFITFMYQMFKGLGKRFFMELPKRISFLGKVAVFSLQGKTQLEDIERVKLVQTGPDEQPPKN